MVRSALLVGGLALLLAGCSATPLDEASTPSATVIPVAVVAVPTTISIPKLKVRDEIVPVGLQKDGTMEVPTVDKTGWYDLGPKPGQPGRATIIGHVNYDGVAGALERLGSLVFGDEITVTSSDGVVRVFKVTLTKTFKKTVFSQNTAIMFGPSAVPVLNLVTCSGTVHDHEYDSNTLVQATEET